MSVQYATVEVWVLVDAAGDYVAHHDADSLADLYGECIQDVAAAEGLRRVKLTVKVPLPAVIELAGEVTADETQTGLTVAG